MSTRTFSQNDLVKLRKYAYEDEDDSLRDFAHTVSAGTENEIPASLADSILRALGPTPAQAREAADRQLAALSRMCGLD